MNVCIPVRCATSRWSNARAVVARALRSKHTATLMFYVQIQAALELASDAANSSVQLVAVSSAQMETVNLKLVMVAATIWGIAVRAVPAFVRNVRMKMDGRTSARSARTCFAMNAGIKQANAGNASAFSATNVPLKKSTTLSGATTVPGATVTIAMLPKVVLRWVGRSRNR